MFNILLRIILILSTLNYNINIKAIDEQDNVFLNNIQGYTKQNDNQLNDTLNLLGIYSNHENQTLIPSIENITTNFNKPDDKLEVIEIAEDESRLSKSDNSNNTKYLPMSFADIVEPLIPAVVNIYTVHYRKNSSNSSPLGNNFPFEQFQDFFEQFNIPFGYEEMYSDPKAVSLGSGFIIDPEGLIVTNHHVVSNADEINVKLMDNTELPAKLIGSDQRSDLALLKVVPKNPLPSVKFGNSSKARVGDWVIAIGNPFGLGSTVTTGIISSKGRDIDVSSGSVIDDFIQTDAAINRGNSGGPMFNIYGEVIGVNTAIFSPSGTNIGIGFSIPSDTAQKIIEKLKVNGKITRGKLDVTIQEVTSEIAEGFGLSNTNGALVVEVMKDGAADRAGIMSGDIIVEFNGQSVKNSRKLQVMVAETTIDKEVEIVVIRNGKKLKLKTKITDTEKPSIKDEENSAISKKGDGFVENHGVTFSDINDEIRKQLSINQNIEGIIVTAVKKNSYKYGYKVGDIVVAVVNSEKQYTKIQNISQLIKYINNAKISNKQNIVMLVKRKNIDLFIAMPIV